MSTLTLVRHGQARAFEEDADRLSEVGERQARMLGQWWSAHGISFTEAYRGTLVRQRKTAEIAGFENATPDSAWNEYDAAGILATLAPELAARDRKFAQLVETFERHRHTPEANRHFQPMFESVISRWLNGEVQSPCVEPWSSFQARVIQALRSIIENGAKGRRILIVTSGGPIGTAVQTALQAPVEKAIELNWRIRNCSVTELLFSNGRVALDCFNATPHLTERSLITYR